MLNETITGVSQKLNQVFGEDCEINIGSIKQNLLDGSFLITPLKGSQEQVIGNLYLRKQPFDIIYYPKDKDDIISETSAIIASLQMELEYITVVGESVRGTKMEYEVVDDILHIFVDYDLRIRKELVPDEYMETLLLTEEVKINGR